MTTELVWYITAATVIVGRVRRKRATDEEINFWTTEECKTASVNSGEN